MQPSYPATPPGRAWRIAHAPIVTLVLGMLSIIGAGLLVSGALKLAGVAHRANAPGGYLALVPQVVATVIAYRLFNRWIERRANVEFAPAGGLRELGAGLVGGLLLFSTVIGVIALGGGYRITGLDPAMRIAPVLAVGFGAAFLEEIVLRGLIFRLLEQWLGSWVALAVSAALFGAGHLANPHATLLAGIAIALEAGIMLAALYMLTRRLWGAIGLHAGWNMTQGGLYGVPISGGAMHGVFAERTGGPTLLTGGAFGAEASLPAIIVCTAFGVALLVLCRRRDRIVPLLPRRRAIGRA